MPIFVLNVIIIIIIVLKGAIDMPPRPLGPGGPRPGERGGLGAGRPRRPGGLMPPPPPPRPRMRPEPPMPFGGPPPHHRRHGGSLLGTITAVALGGAIANSINEIQRGRSQSSQQAYNQGYNDASNMPTECPNCGANATGSRFCTYCGTKLY